jgi:hypothetical protein
VSWNPGEPITSWNHPPCDACDWLGKIRGKSPKEVGVPCTCFDWPTSEDDHATIVKLTNQVKQLKEYMATILNTLGNL